MAKKFFPIRIEFHMMPTKVFEIEPLGLIIYSSVINRSQGRYSRASKYLEMIIYGEEEELTGEKIKKKVIDFIRFATFIIPHYEGKDWLRKFSHQLEPKKENLWSYSYLTKYIEQTCIPNLKEFNWLYKIDYNDFSYPFNPLHSNKIDFKSLFIIYCSLPIGDKLRNQIELFVAVEILPISLGPIYDNDNLQKSAMFILAETIIKEYVTETATTRQCQHCENEIPGQKGLTRMIQEFVDQLDFSNQNKEVMVTVIKKISSIRHSFFHAGKATTDMEASDKLLEKVGGNIVTLSQELKFGDGRFSGYMLLRNFLQDLLISKVTSVSLSDESKN